jgi:hypothetical protein
MSDTWKGSSSNWFSNSNWTNKTPKISSSGTQSVVISGTASSQPVISPTASGASDIWVAQTVMTNGTTYTVLQETQIDGQHITLTNGADLTIQGIALGAFYGAADTNFNQTLTGLHGAMSSTPIYDSNMVISAIGTDTLTVDAINENFGLIEAVGSGNRLVINNSIGGNPQALHGLINYGEISIGSGGEIDINAVVNQGTTVANFYNAGWIVDNGGTLNITASVLDGTNTASSSTTMDGYIEIENSGNVILSNTVSAHEEVLFADATANTLQVTAGTLFSGTVANFGPTDTIIVNGFTSTSNATLVTTGGVTKLLTTNGSVTTTITLAGSVSTEITTGTNSSGQEIIRAGATNFTSGSSKLGNVGTTATVTNSSTITLTGAGTTFNVYDSLVGSGAFIIENGATLAVDNLTGNDAGQSVVFGTIGASTTPNMLLINDNTSGFGGPITGFGADDAIYLGGSMLPALNPGEGLALNYTGGVLTVAESNASGSTVHSTVLTVAGTAALSTASFVALETNRGIEIETAPAQSGKIYSFSLSSSAAGDFESPASFVGGVAPGDIIASGEIVSIVAGAASVSSGGVTDNGTIAVDSTFIDAGSLIGTGTLSIAAGANATLTGNTTLGLVINAGTLTLGGTDATPISLASGAQVIIANNFSDSSAITGPGTLTVNSGVTATLAGSSLTSVKNYATLDLLGSFTGPINMEGNGAHSAVAFSGEDVTNHTLNTVLTNFGTGDTIMVESNAFPLSGNNDKLAESYNANTEQLTVTDATSGASLVMNVQLASGDQANWISVNDVDNTLEVTLCFYPGTALATPAGEVAVENLRAGDLVTTANGVKPVRWIGQSRVCTRFADPLRSLPIRIRAGALGSGLPKRDLLLSPDHAIFMDGILIQASALVNNISIVREASVPETFTYYHVELETHELLSAEGVPAESFVDNIGRMHFYNWDEREASAEPIEEMLYPRAKSIRQVPQAIRLMLAAQEVA